VLPHGVPIAKLAAIQRLGAEPLLADGGYDGAHETARTVARERGMRYVHAFDDDLVIAGQGTLALELVADADVDTIVVPIGGGGLAAGVALAVADRHPRPRLIGVQAEGAPAFAASFARGALVERPAASIADGIAVRRPSDRTFAIARAALDDVITVGEEAIARAIVFMLERHKLVAEGAGAASVAAILEGNGHVGGRRVAAIVSGGNIDPNLLTKVLQQGLASAGRYLAFRTWLDDRPGMLHEITGILAAERINILHVGIHRLGPYAALGRVGLDVIVDTRDRAHADSVLALIRGHGFPAEELDTSAP
jgi:threonine dehydratase